MSRLSMNQAMNGRSIMFQVMAPSLILIVIGFLAVGVITAWSRANSAEDMFRHKVELSAKLSQDSATNSLWEMDSSAISHSLAPIIGDPDQKLVMIVDTSGNSFFASGSPALRPVAMQALKRVGGLGRLSTVKAGPYVVSVTPLRHVEFGAAEALGDMVIVYDTSAVVAAAWSAVLWVVGVGAVVVGFVIAVLFALTRRIAKPLDELAIAMAALSAGDLETVVENLERRDEIGGMARAVQVFKDNALRLRASETEGARLLEARLRAEAANRAKSEFLANMSHELRTPLNGVLTMAHLMARGDLNQDQRGKLEVILRSGKNLLHVINDILDFSKIEAGRLDLECIAFDAAGVMEDVRSSLAAVAESKGLDLRLTVAPEARGARLGDPVRLRQIVNNFVSNALKFTHEGAVEISLGATGEGGRNGLLIAVKDSGAGIAPDGMALLFQKFSQVDTSTTRQYGGTGLGLAICRELAGLMGGRVWAESEVGVGSTFWADVSVPAIADPGLAPDLEEVVTAEADMGDRPLRILAAEDNLTNRTVLQAIMDAFGFNLVLACNGREVIDTWRRQAFDIILMDISMPVMDGMEATRVIRAEEASSGIARTPIIALTANAFRHQVDEYAAVGMDGHLSKPIDISALHAVIHQTLSPKAGASDPEADAEADQAKHAS